MTPPDSMVDYYRSHESEVKSVEAHLKTIEEQLSLAMIRHQELKVILANLDSSLSEKLDVLMRMISVLGKPLDTISDKQDQLLDVPKLRPLW